MKQFLTLSVHTTPRLVRGGEGFLKKTLAAGARAGVVCNTEG